MNPINSAPQTDITSVSTVSYLPFMRVRARRAHPAKAKKTASVSFAFSVSHASATGVTKSRSVEVPSGAMRLKRPEASVRSGLYWAMVCVHLLPPPTMAAPCKIPLKYSGATAAMSAPSAMKRPKPSAREEASEKDLACLRYAVREADAREATTIRAVAAWNHETMLKRMPPGSPHGLMMFTTEMKRAVAAKAVMAKSQKPGSGRRPLIVL